MNIVDFRKKLEELPREELLEILNEQDPDITKQIKRIEWVFENKLGHLYWNDGTRVISRNFTNAELALLVDQPFFEDKTLTKMGVKIDQQRELHIVRDPVLWARHYLNVEPRIYQTLILRHPNNRKILRAGRRLGKTFSMAILLLHYSYTHNDGRCIVVAPMKSQVELIYQEITRLAARSQIVSESITRKVTSPQFMIQLSNGSTIRFFTSGIRSGGKADVVRGQEAHIIVLDEMDYMHTDDLDSLYAMLQKTSEDQDEKILVGASTPTGRRDKFWDWCRSPRFSEFWYPSYCNPFFDQDTENEFRSQYTEMAYRHEIEADWGEDSEGVYPRKFIDLAFSSGLELLTDKEKAKENSDILKSKSDWDYIPAVVSARSFFIFGVDWDKYGAGCNIVVLEVCDSSYEDIRFQNKARLVYREEVKKDEYTLTAAVQRIISLNQVFQPRHIYVDRGYGEVQVELLHKYGVENPSSNLKKRVKGISFSESIEVKDPFTKQNEKKEIKPYMVDNLRQMLEKQSILFASHDEELYLQLISYVVVRKTSLGRPVFEASGSAQDHVHDALILACLALNQNYGDLMKVRYATKAKSVSNDVFLNLLSTSGDYETSQDEIEKLESAYGSKSIPVFAKRSMTVNLRKRTSSRPIQRKKF